MSFQAIQSIGRIRLPLIGAAVLFVSSAAWSQSFNIDFHGTAGNLGTPGNCYGAASGSAGFWNGVDFDMPLLDLAGAATGVAITLNGVDIAYAFGAICTDGEDAMLMDDIMYTTSTSGFFTITGLAPGDYTIYTYAMAPDSAAFTTDVSVVGSTDALQTVGGDFCSGFVQLTTHAIHHVTVAAGSTPQIDVAVNNTYTSLNGMQIILGGPEPGACSNQGTSYCDGSTGNCPGGVAGAVGHGCPSSNPNGNGGLLDDTGNASFSNDTYGFLVTDGAQSKPGIMIQGANAIGYPTGNPTVPGSAGLFCVAPQLRGKVTFTDATGAVTITEFDAGVAFGAGAQAVGSTTYYQYWQRDPNNVNANGGAGSGNFNFTNAVETNWIN